MSKIGIVSLVCIVCSVFSVRPAQTDGDISITFRYKDFSGQIVRVFLPGEFNSWNTDFDGVSGPSLMTFDESEGFWMKQVRLQVGSSCAYKFYFHLDQSGSQFQWTPDPLNETYDGSMYINSLLTVTDPMIFQPTLKRNFRGQIESITAGIFGSEPFEEVWLILDDEYIDVRSSFNPGTGILNHSFGQGLSEEARIQIMAKDTYGRLGRSVEHEFPPYPPELRKIDVTFLFHANQHLVPAGKVGSLACFVGLLEVLRNHPLLKFQLHFSGTLLHDLLWFDDTAIQLIQDGLDDGQFEIFGSTYAQNIMYSTRMTPDDFQFNDHQIQIHKDLIEHIFDVTPHAFWNCERVWTQNFVQLLADNGYDYVQIEGYIIEESGTTEDVHVVRTTSYNGRQIVVFNDNQDFMNLVDHAIDEGDIYNVLNYLHERYDEDVNDEFVIGYYQDAEATGLWDYEEGQNPVADWINLSHLLILLENDPLIKVTTYEEFTQNNSPVEELTPIVDGAATWMFQDAWFTLNNHPNFEEMRELYDSIRDTLNSVSVAIQTFPGDTLSASKLLQHAWFTLAAHQFEFGVHGYTHGNGTEQWQLARTAQVSALAAKRALNSTTESFVDDVNLDEKDEYVMVDANDMFVFSPYGGRLLYWFDLDSGEELVGNENFMVCYSEPYVDDTRYIPTVMGGVDTYKWLWGNPIFPEVFEWKFTIRRRALNDWISINNMEPGQLRSELDLVSMDPQSLTFHYSGDRFDVHKAFTRIKGGLGVTYTFVSKIASDLDVTLEIESGFCPSLMEVMNNGRSALAYWDGANTYQYVFGSIIGVINTVTGSAVYYDFNTLPQYLAGEENVFGLELNPTFGFTIPSYDSYTINFSLLRSGLKAPKGDVNGDGFVDIIDAVKVINFILSQSTPSPEESEAADCNDDAAINILDALCIINIILGEG
ncbi:MAG: hypothetical protein JSV84_09225 [Gemmatimonadota bacterium]|nr:MAG: hypothetical protein JSV84_09225 [Gemmatimonadota bacterium]